LARTRGGDRPRIHPFFSDFLDGKRTLSMDLINQGIADATGHNPRFNGFESPALGVCYLQHSLQQRTFHVEVVSEGSLS
jgi:hypothetical protein